ncbi:CheR family methyltransferase [Aurantivibrio plasticivorans]
MRTESEREFAFSDKNFQCIQRIAYDSTGIKLSDHKRNMVYGRLARRLRRLNLNGFDEYCDILESRAEPEFREFVNSITTNLTSFFRESYHFDFLRDTAIPEILELNKTTRRLRCWSAGCSTGEEPYSIAITLAEKVPLKSWDCKLLATDLDTNVVAKAKSGIYSFDRVERIPEEKMKRFFRRSRDMSSVSVKEEIRNIITFNPLNLLHEWPMKGPFDFIFCRNVVIYFDKDTQRVLFDRMANMLSPNGYLFIGHSENLHRVSNRFKSLGRTIYQRIN